MDIAMAIGVAGFSGPAIPVIRVGHLEIFTSCATTSRNVVPLNQPDHRAPR
ncbi:MAG TPA: hypothetical protein PLS63_05810 [Microthrixaceae bacterium]|nr:hypothetical protein [Microthrixaceae bacterium]